MGSGLSKENRAVYFIVCHRFDGRRAMPYAVKGRTGRRRPFKTSVAGAFFMYRDTTSNHYPFFL